MGGSNPVVVNTASSPPENTLETSGEDDDPTKPYSFKQTTDELEVVVNLGSTVLKVRNFTIFSTRFECIFASYPPVSSVFSASS